MTNLIFKFCFVCQGTPDFIRIGEVFIVAAYILQHYSAHLGNHCNLGKDPKEYDNER